jgi:nucleoside-diphosphate-sugar epimerase
MRFDLTINQFAMEAIRDRKLVIFSPKAWRPYIHIRDVADAVLACIQAEENKVRREVYNLGRNDMSFTKMEIATLVQKMIPGTEVEVKGAGTDLRDYRVDFSKWAKSFPGIPNRSIEQGLAELKSVLEDWKIIINPEQEKYRNA